MGRVQTFESAAVVRAARDVFWDKGYEGASVAELEAATGLNRSSLYHAFGSKRGLFDTAVRDYLDTVVRPRLRILTGRAPDAADLIAYFENVRAAVGALDDDSPRQGCLLVNCATGLAGHDRRAREVVEAYRAELTGALRDALAAASTASTPAAVLDARARTLASLSMSAMLLARVNRSESMAMLTAACEQVTDWFAAQPSPVAETISSSAP